MWVQIYVLGTFEMERKRQDLEILVWRSCPLEAPSSLSSDNAWQGPKLSFYFQKLKERIPAKLGNVHLLPCKYVSLIFQREREREKTKNCTVYKLFIHVYIYTLIWYMCIWYGVPCSYSNFECIFKSLRCSISTLVFDTSPPKSFAMDFPKNHRKCGVAYYSRRSACKCTWVRSSSCHFKHSSKGNNPVKGSKQ